MDTQEQMQAFRNELIRRFDELTHWAIDNWPDKGRPLTAVDFVQIREQMAVAGVSREDVDKQKREPSEGGPQYRDIDPTPWP